MPTRLIEAGVDALHLSGSQQEDSRMSFRQLSVSMASAIPGEYEYIEASEAKITVGSSLAQNYKTMARFPEINTRSLKTNFNACDSTIFSTSLPSVAISAAVCRWFTSFTSWAIIGPSSKSLLTK